MDSIQEIVTEILLGRPQPFSFGKREFMIYPETLGSSAIISCYLEDLDIDSDILAVNPSMEALRQSRLHKETVCKIIAVATCRGDECLQSAIIRERINIFSSELSDENLAELLMLTLNRSKWPRLTALLGLNEERNELFRIAELRSRTSGMKQYGGRSLFGTLLDNVCSRYGWSDRYVIWGISLDRLRMMLADSVNSVYLTEEERKKLNIFSSDEFIDGDTADIETLRELTSH